MALKGLRVVEMAGLAPGPFCGMILSDFGASVIRIDRVNAAPLDRLARGKRSVAVNLKKKEGVAIVKKLANQADVFIEPYRPGVMEKLGIGPTEALEANPRLIYARLTGFGQDGPMSQMAGHDINYVALSGILSMLGGQSKTPQAPLNLLADFAGGGLLCAFGIVMALLERTRTGRGQVVDASMTEGAAYVGSWLFKSRDLPVWGEGRGKSWFDGGTHFYGTYETKDGKFMSVGAIEGQFYKEFLEKMQLDQDDWPQYPDNLDSTKEKLAGLFRKKTQQEWRDIFDTSDACVLPVLSLDEAAVHPHNDSRKSFYQNLDGEWEPTPAPRLSSHEPIRNVDSREVEIGKHTIEILQELGYTAEGVESILKQGAASAANAKASL